MTLTATPDTATRREDFFGLAAGLAVIWFVLLAALGVFLFAENKARVGADGSLNLIGACAVPGGAGSAYGHGVWQSWPPGTRCERGTNLDVAPTTPRVWGRPGPWRGVAVTLLGLSGAVLAAAFWRLRDRE